MKTNPKTPIAALVITGDWSKQEDELKDLYPTLTFSDLKFVRGKEEELIKRIEMRLHKKRKEVIEMIKKVQPAKH